MEITNNTYRQVDLEPNNKTALRLMLYIAMASITMFFAVSTSALIVKKADILNWAQFPLPSVFTVSTVIAVLSSFLFYLTYKTYQQNKFSLYIVLLAVSGLISFAFLVSQYLGFEALKAMDFPLDGQVSGSYIYFLAIAHALHIIVGLGIVVVVFFKSKAGLKNMRLEGGGKQNPRRVLGLELLTTYWHFVNALWVYLFLFFYFNYQ